MKLEPYGVGRERPARQPRPFDRALAFLDPLLARAALVVEREHALGRAAHVRHDEADARINFFGMPLDLGNHPARINVESAVAPSGARQASSDLTTATVPAGTSFPLCRGNPVISLCAFR